MKYYANRKRDWNLECLGTSFHKIASFKNVKRLKDLSFCASGFRALRMYVEGQIEALQVRPHFQS